MIEYEVAPKSRNDIRRIANYFREVIGVESMIYIPIVEILDIMAEIDDDFSYEVIADDQLPDEVHAYINVTTKHISIKESVYNGACTGCGRDRMTIAHEIGHYILTSVFGFSVRNENHGKKPEAYRTPEWQAKCFAGELLMKKEHIMNMSIGEIMSSCGVSNMAATYHYSLLHRNDVMCA